MNKLYILILITSLLVACSKSTTETTAPASLLEKQNTLPPTVIIPRPTTTPTQEPSPTQKPTSTNTPTEVAAVTSKPSQTPIPTDENSIYDLADCLPTNTLVQTGLVDQVFDGDTISVLLEDGKTYTERFIGMDAPEKDIPFFTEAFIANTDLVLHKEVMLIKDVSETDPYNRLLRYVIVDGVFVNLELVKMGFAKAVQYPPDVACADAFLSAEQEAQAAQAGIWVATATPEASAAEVIIIAVNKRDEYVDLQNIGDTDVDLSGWNLISERVAKNVIYRACSRRVKL